MILPSLQSAIDQAFENRHTLTPDTCTPTLKTAISDVIEALDSGELRVANKGGGTWHVNEWVKKAVLLYFRIHANTLQHGAYTQYFDKVPNKFAQYTEEDFQAANVRVVPSATVRKGAFVGSNTVLMPSYINIGAYVDTGVMVDTWATVGSCAQIGKNVHLSGGAGIGGVLEPLQAQPTIIEDNCFIGARSEIVEGVLVEQGAVISMGVYLGQSTRIYNRITGEVTYGRVPAGSVVVPGSLPAKDGSHSLYCAIIVKQVDEKTRKKVSVNELLRNHSC